MAMAIAKAEAEAKAKILKPIAIAQEPDGSAAVVQQNKKDEAVEPGKIRQTRQANKIYQINKISQISPTSSIKQTDQANRGGGEQQIIDKVLEERLCSQDCAAKIMQPRLCSQGCAAKVVQLRLGEQGKKLLRVQAAN